MASAMETLKFSPEKSIDTMRTSEATLLVAASTTEASTVMMGLTLYGVTDCLVMEPPPSTKAAMTSP